MYKKKTVNDEGRISPVIGTILMVVITLIVSGIVAFFIVGGEGIPYVGGGGISKNNVSCFKVERIANNEIIITQGCDNNAMNGTFTGADILITPGMGSDGLLKFDPVGGDIGTLAAPKGSITKATMTNFGQYAHVEIVANFNDRGSMIVFSKCV